MDKPMRNYRLPLLAVVTLLLAASCTLQIPTNTPDLPTLSEATAAPNPTPALAEEEHLYLPALIKPEDPAPPAGSAANPEQSDTPTNPEYPAPETSPSPAVEQPTPTAEPVNRLPPENWQEWPVVPVVSERAKEIFHEGLAMGNSPNAFSKVGDCQNIRQYFMGIFDDPSSHRLGEKYAYLQPTIDNFPGSFIRTSMAVRTGFNVASVLASFYSDPEQCQAGEIPLECELRIWRPTIVIISMETWDENRPTDAYENYLRKIVDITIEHGAVPIVATKADNLEGDHSINAAVARVAYDYNIPLWNFWREVQPLPEHGLMEDGFHLTYDANFYDDPHAMEAGWPHRNLTALQALDAVWRAVSGYE
jgi:hypothetical protein